MTDKNLENFGILVVDDDLQFGRLVQRIFQQMNRTIDIALTGADAIAKAQNSNRLIVYLDINLPDLPSLAVAEAIRSQPNLKVVIIGLSGHSRSEVSNFVSSSFIDFYEQKPMSLGELKNILLASMTKGAQILSV